MRTAATLFRQICYNNKDFLQAGIIVAGWDKYTGGSVYNIPLGGSIHKQPFAIGGIIILSFPRVDPSHLPPLSMQARDQPTFTATATPRFVRT